MKHTTTQKKVSANQTESVQIMKEIIKTMYNVDDKMDWSHVGSSEEVKERLQEVLEFISK